MSSVVMVIGSAMRGREMNMPWNWRQVLLRPILLAKLLNDTFIGRKLVGMMNRHFELEIRTILSDK
jgi:hypothetical protein